METLMERRAERTRTNERIGRTVKALLRYRGMTARQLGDAIGEAETTVSKLTKGRQSWQAVTLNDTADVLDVEVAVLFTSPVEALERVGMTHEAAETFVRNSGLGGGAGDRAAMGGADADDVVGRAGLEPAHVGLKAHRSATELPAPDAGTSVGPEPAGSMPKAA